MFNTPLANIINFPETENKLFKASIYNSLAIILLIVIGLSMVSVYFLFEIFIKPLMWALLVGTCLFPFKRSLTKFLHNWIFEMGKNNQPLIVGATLFPFNLFLKFAEWITDIIISRKKLFLFYVIGVPLIYSIYNMGIISTIFSSTTTIYFSASRILSIFGSKIVSLMIVTMVVVIVAGIINNMNIKILKVLSSCVWLLIIVYISNFAGSFALFLFTFTIALLTFGAFVESMNIDLSQLSLSQLVLLWELITRPYKCSHKHDDHNVLSEEEIVSENDTMESQSPDVLNRNLDDSSVSESAEDACSQVCNDALDHGDEAEATQTKKNKVNFFIDTMTSTMGWCSNLFSPVSKSSPKKLMERSSSSCSNTKNRHSTRVSKKRHNKTLVSRVFICLLWSHIIMYSWSHLWIILVMILAFLLVTIKKILMKLEINDLISWLFNMAKVKINKLLGDKMDIFFPVFIRGSFRIFLQCDEKLRKVLDSCLDNLVSMFLIAFLVLGTIFLTIFLAFQVHNESLHLIALTSDVMNSTMSSELYSWLPERKDITSLIETVTNNAYLFGRDWISKKIDQLFDTNAYNKAKIEDRALEFWEKLYQRVLIKNSTNTSSVFKHPFHTKLPLHRQSPILSLQNYIYGFWDLLTSFDMLDFNKISNLIQENLGLLSTVLESVWLVIRSNLNLVLSLSTGLFSAILGGGTVVLNFFVSMIIFLSALYYLLSYSKERYLPLEMIAALTPNADNSPGLQSIYTSVENGISSVFAVTLKMACFYGFYTSLTHTISGVNLVVIPSITAALLAAVPLVGTYWAAVPAITELVFINQEYITASVLFLFHLMPMYILDTAIYSEIKETGHPYLTGLAIAGGVYWLGLQGAVIGPLLLCTLVIVLNLFKSLIKPETLTESVVDSYTEKPMFKSPKLLKKSRSCDRTTYH